MNRILLTHQWKAFWRSRGKNKSIALHIAVGFLVLYFLMIALLFGHSLGPILQRKYGAGNAVYAYCSFILYYFAFDIFIRFQFQELPTMALQPYLLQNIRRRQLVRFLNARSLFSFFNLLPFLLFIPFTLTTIGGQYGGIAASAFIVCLFSVCIGNHFLVLFIKRKTENSNKWLLAFFIVVAVLATLNYFKVISIGNFSALVFTGVLHKPLLSLITIIYAAYAFYINSNLLLNNFYFEATASSGESNWQNSLLGKLTTQGSLNSLEIKSILRNKRPRALLFKSFIFLAYGFVVFKKHDLDNNQYTLAVIGSTIVVGIFTVNYGQFLLAWQSAYFDGLMTNNVDFKTFIKSKFRLLALICTFSFVISLLYGFIDWHLPFILFAAYLLNIGLLPIIAGYFATINYKGIDIGKASAFKSGGGSMVQMLYTFAIFIITAIIYTPFQIYGHYWMGLATIGGIGLINFLLQNWWIGILYKQFIKNKYKILEGFREK
jgi:hypothetical protein